MNGAATPIKPERTVQAEKRLIRRGVAWNAVGTGVAKAASILAKLLLARLLLPEHFGFISMIVVFTSAAKILADLGFALSLVQRSRDQSTKLLYDSAFWLLVAVSFIAIGLMWLVGIPLMVWFYGEPRLSDVALVMSTVILFQNMQVVPEARLARAMCFKPLAIANIIGILLGCISAIVLAIAGAGVWSLVAQSLIATACTSVSTFVLSGWRPRARFNGHILRQLGSFSRFIVGSRILISFQQNVDYLLIGKLMGASALGIYAIAYLLTETLRSQAYWLVSKAVFPFYSRAMGRDAEIRTVYVGTIRYMSAAVFPIATLLVLFADPLVHALFTARWNAAIMPIQILAVASILVSSGGTPGEVLRGIGRPDIDFKLNLGVAALVALPTLWVGIQWYGLTGAGLAVLAYSGVSRFAFGVALYQTIGVRWGEVFRALERPLLGCLAMAVARTILGHSAHWTVAFVAGCAIYCLIIRPLIVPQVRKLGLLFGVSLLAVKSASIS